MTPAVLRCAAACRLYLPHLRQLHRWPVTSQLSLADALLSALQSRGAPLPLWVIRDLLYRVAALPALPASKLLLLLSEAGSSTGSSTAASGRAAVVPGEQVVDEDVDSGVLPTAARESLFSALARLDDSEAAWRALSELCSKVGWGNDHAAPPSVTALRPPCSCRPPPLSHPSLP